jgi:hypothetical protein
VGLGAGQRGPVVILYRDVTSYKGSGRRGEGRSFHEHMQVRSGVGWRLMANGEGDSESEGTLLSSNAWRRSG